MQDGRDLYRMSFRLKSSDWRSFPSLSDGGIYGILRPIGAGKDPGLGDAMNPAPGVA